MSHLVTRCIAPTLALLVVLYFPTGACCVDTGSADSVEQFRLFDSSVRLPYLQRLESVSFELLREFQNGQVTEQQFSSVVVLRSNFVVEIRMISTALGHELVDPENWVSGTEAEPKFAEVRLENADYSATARIVAPKSVNSVIMNPTHEESASKGKLALWLEGGSAGIPNIDDLLNSDDVKKFAFKGQFSLIATTKGLV